MDLATLLGLAVSLGVVLYAMFLGGNLASFIDIPALLIVVVGTFFVTMVSFSLTEIARSFIIMAKAFVHEVPNAQTEASRLVLLAQKTRKAGFLAMQKEMAAEQEEFLRNGLVLAVDGIAPDTIEKIMRLDTTAMLERHAAGLAILKRAAEIAPSMGLIGTLIGLVQMLGQLSDPDRIGPAMAVALLGTFYGAVMAFMVFTPLAGKLERTSHEELLLRKVYTTAAMSIARQENPRQLEIALNAILPPNLRISVFR